MERKSQISAEFMIVIAILLIIFLSLFIVISKKNSQADSLRKALYAREIADKISASINSAFISGDGTSITEEISGSFKDGTPYTISIYPSVKIVEITYTSQLDTRHYSSTITTSSILGDITQINSTITISNSNGVIYIEK